MTSPSSTAMSHTDAQPRDWQGIGTYLEQKNVQLLETKQQAVFLGTWCDITRQVESLEDAILIGLVGGTGVGKSTFINALAGQEVSRSSDRRPTTDRVIVYRHVSTDMPGEVPADDFAQPEVLHDNDKMQKVVLFDFPDFDSAEDAHTHIIRKYLPFLDVLLVVVDDVKYADRRLYELLSTLDHDPRNVFVILNKIDRLANRYGDDTERVISELVADLDEKLKKNSGLKLAADQMFPVAALAVYLARTRQEQTPASERFSKVESMLEGFQEDKHRRAAKERNIDSRKRELTTALVNSALGEENEAVLAEARMLVQSWRGELDKAIRSVPVEILGDSERSAVRGARLRLSGPSWGLPFSLFFTLLGEIRRRSATAVEPSELGQRILHHYSSFFDAIKNVRARFQSEFASTKIKLSINQPETTDIVRISPSQISADLQKAVQQEREHVPLGRRWMAHVPAIGTLFLALWGKIYDLLDGERGILGSIFDTLSPTFIMGTIVGVLLVYGLTAFVIWLREIQKLDHEITKAEQKTREIVRKSGQDAVDHLDADVKSLHDEFEQLESLIERKAT